MKKLLFGFMALMLLSVSVQAQDAKTLMKDAKKGLSKFQLDNSDKESLVNAATAIEAALKTSELQNDASAYNLKGDINNEVANQILAARQLNFDAGALTNVKEPAFKAFEAYKMGLEKAEKKYHTKDALKGLQQIQGALSNLGIFAYESGDYELAYRDFEAMLSAHDILDKEGEKSALDNEADLYNQMYITGLAALNGENMAAAKKYFGKLYEKNYEKPAIYEALYKIEAGETDANTAYMYLEKGRKLYPEDTSLLFAEINHYLQSGQMDKLVSKLDEAIKAEPDNVSLYSVMGNVYDNKYQALAKEGEAKADEANAAFDNALKYYEMALEKDAKYVNAIYSIGALYYNRAAQKTMELNELADDYSKEGVAKYEAKKEEIFAEFDNALPYFKRAEAIDPNDINTLIALKEIFARKDQLDVSTEFKQRLEKVQAGEKNDASYFKN